MKSSKVRFFRKKLKKIEKKLADYQKYDNLPTSKSYFIQDIHYGSITKKSRVKV
jgi:hypothetical protein